MNQHFKSFVQLSMVSLLCVNLAFGQAQFEKGDEIQFQWGPDQLRATVHTSFGDQSHGKSNKFSIRAINAQRVTDKNEKLHAPRIKVGDYVENFLDPDCTGKVIELDGAFATILSPVDGKSERRTATIDSLEKLAEVPVYARPSTPSSASGNSQGIREWVDRTGKHKVEAIFVGIRDGNVQLRKPNSNKVITLPLSKLSESDQDFVAAHDIRYVDFTPPADMKPVTTSVSLNEKSAVIGYGTGFQPPITKLVILNLQSKDQFRVVDIPKLDKGMCRAISDDGKFVFTHHQKTDSFDPETKQKEVSWYWTIWDCSGPTALAMREFKTEPMTLFENDATWIDDKHLFFR